MKYQGNKNRIVKDILPIIMSYRKPGQWYVEPFCGSCSVLQHVPESRIASDKNKYLIAMWKSLTAGKKMPTEIMKDFYSDVRNCFNGKTDLKFLNMMHDKYSETNPDIAENIADVSDMVENFVEDGKYSDDLIGWVGYMASFNGRFFDGGYSGHKVMGSNGKERDYIRENIANTMKQVPYLQDVQWQSGDYYDIEIPPNSLIYCDPPYRNTKEYQFSRGFDYDRFYDWCVDMTRKGHTVLVSEYEMPEDRFECIWSKEVTNAMNPTNTKKAVEKLFKVKA